MSGKRRVNVAVIGAGFILGRDVIEVVYAGYLSAAEGRRVELG